MSWVLFANNTRKKGCLSNLNSKEWQRTAYSWLIMSGKKGVYQTLIAKNSKELPILG